eukprot:TRINITY_DN114199_c0_g1_i1.p1 TRINITY_DN114199_c0_g1~~TRINITY_DN114199_c0_g1_i1.p1  ORF type:complete len:169 (-),score=26.95 TRINITY_DN114199_c0_g1_i1:384-890(-)
MASMQCSAEEVRVLVQTLTGAELEVLTDSSQSVGSLKEQIQQEWLVPTTYQRLTCGASIVADWHTVADLCDGDCTTEAMVVLTISDVPATAGEGQITTLMPYVQWSQRQDSLTFSLVGVGGLQDLWVNISDDGLDLMVLGGAGDREWVLQIADHLGESGQQTRCSILT